MVSENKKKPDLIFSIQVYNLTDVNFTISICNHCRHGYISALPASMGYTQRVGNQYHKCSMCRQYTKVGLEWQKNKKQKKSP